MRWISSRSWLRRSSAASSAGAERSTPAASAMIGAVAGDHRQVVEQPAPQHVRHVARAAARMQSDHGDHDRLRRPLRAGRRATRPQALRHLGEDEPRRHRVVGEQVLERRPRHLQQRRVAACTDQLAALPTSDEWAGVRRACR